MSARQAAFEKIKLALGDSVRRVGDIGGVDLGFRPDREVDLWVPLKVQVPWIMQKTGRDIQCVNWQAEIENHLVLICEAGQIGIVLSSAAGTKIVYTESLTMVKATCVTLSDTLALYQHLCRPWGAIELMSPVFRKRQEKKAMKCVAETSAVNKTIPTRLRGAGPWQASADYRGKMRG